MNWHTWKIGDEDKIEDNDAFAEQYFRDLELEQAA